MVASCGKWLSAEEFRELSGLSEDETAARLGTGELLSKLSGEREYIWVDVPDGFIDAGKGKQDMDHEAEPKQDTAVPAEPGSAAASVKSEIGAASSAPAGGPAPGRDLEKTGSAEAKEDPVSETLVSRFSATQELALQAERAISLVERSLSAFMMMHSEVMVEKDRAVERAREGLTEKTQSIHDLEAEVQKLKQVIKEKDQEIADLKMLAEILEGRAGRAAPAEASRDHVERASVGDLMEEQLRYIMEDQMIKDLLK